MLCYDHLGDTVTVVDDKANIRMVDKNYLNLTSVV